MRCVGVKQVNMKIKILAFGIVKDIFNHSSIELDAAEGCDVKDLKTLLEQQYPRLKQLASYLIAVNNEYAEAGQVIDVRDEVAIIPPVSGG